jgi:hypothetical protein
VIELRFWSGFDDKRAIAMCLEFVDVAKNFRQVRRSYLTEESRL